MTVLSEKTEIPKLDTQIAQAGTRRDPTTGAISTPVYLCATFAHPALGESTGYDYSRTANPTRQAFEDAVARMEGGTKAHAFASGLAAIDAIMRLFQPGDVIVSTEDLYGGTMRLFEKICVPAGLKFVYLDTSDTTAVAAALDQPGVRGLFVESPTNPILRVADLPALGKLTRARNQVFIVDNTFFTAWLQRPMEDGADLVIYSATKYLSGHSDLVAGVVVSNTPELAERVGYFQNAAGAVLGPLDAWLALRGLKTLPLRMARHQENALALARFLKDHPRVGRVYYPGLPDHPGHHLVAEKQAFGGMIAFEVADPARIPAILANVKVFLFAESLGGVESLITYPSVQTHADIPEADRERLGINNRLLRLSVGIENVNDLIRDLEDVL